MPATISADEIPADLSRQLWGLLAFTLWYERHVEGVRRDVPLEQVLAG